MHSGAMRRQEDQPGTSASDADLPADLRELIDEVRRATACIRVAQAEHAYRLALLAKAATSRRLANRLAAMEACARHVGVARTTLHAFSILATRWGLDELRELFIRQDANGQALSVTHLLLVGHLPRATRDRWINRVLTEGLDVRSLKSLMRSGRPHAHETTGDDATPASNVVSDERFD